MYVQEKGDIVSLNFDPSAGKEIMKRRLVFVIKQKILVFHQELSNTQSVRSTIYLIEA